MRLAHISDLHVLDLKGIKPWRFLNKRVTGGLNLLLGRSKIHRPELLDTAEFRHQPATEHGANPAQHGQAQPMLPPL